MNLEELDTSVAGDAEEIREQPIQKYIEGKRQFRKSERYVSRVEWILNEYQKAIDTHILGVSKNHIAAFNEYLKNSSEFEVNDRTRHGYLNHISSFYNWLIDNGVVSVNPASAALSDFPEDEFDLTPPDRPRIEIEEMQDFLEWLPRAWARAVAMTLLKTGLRGGELVNLDLCCLNLDHPIYKQVLDQYRINLHSRIRDIPDTLYAMPKFSKGSKIRGEVRSNGNKRQAEDGSIIPVDNELKTALLEYLLTRPYTPNHPAQAQPVFVTRDVDRNGSVTPRWTLTGLADAFIRKSPGYVREYGWWESNTDTENKVTTHYFRHYFTHNHKHLKGVYHDSMPENVIAYIRGDVPDSDSARNTNYEHDGWNDWKRQIKEPYLDAIYQFRLYD